MQQVIESLVDRYDGGMMSRRQLVRALGLVATGQIVPGSDVVSVASINHVSLQVSDVQRSVAFYTRTLGLTNEGGDATTARLVSGTCHVSIRREEPFGVIDHFAFGTNRYDQDALTAELRRRGSEPHTDQQFGFHVIDPDGVRVQIIENDQRHRCG